MFQHLSVMSNKTKEMLSKLNLRAASIIRKQNFNYLRNMLGDTFPFSLTDDDVPMVFPYVTDNVNLRQRLIDNKIYVAKYWPGISPSCKYQDRLLAVPIDQRYGISDMHRICEVING